MRIWRGQLQLSFFGLVCKYKAREVPFFGSPNRCFSASSFSAGGCRNFAHEDTMLLEALPDPMTPKSSLYRSIYTKRPAHFLRNCFKGNLKRTVNTCSYFRDSTSRIQRHLHCTALTHAVAKPSIAPKCPPPRT